MAKKQKITFKTTNRNLISKKISNKINYQNIKITKLQIIINKTNKFKIFLKKNNLKNNHLNNPIKANRNNKNKRKLKKIISETLLLKNQHLSQISSSLIITTMIIPGLILISMDKYITCPLIMYLPLYIFHRIKNK